MHWYNSKNSTGSHACSCADYSPLHSYATEDRPGAHKMPYMATSRKQSLKVQLLWRLLIFTWAWHVTSRTGICICKSCSLHLPDCLTDQSTFCSFSLVVSLNVTGAFHYVVLPANDSLPTVVDSQTLTTQPAGALFSGYNVAASGDMHITKAFTDHTQRVLVQSSSSVATKHLCAALC